MVRPPEFVENFMTTPVYEIDEQRKVEEALKKMQSEGTEFLVATKNGVPVGILEEWKIWGVDKNKNVKNIEDKLLPVFTVRSRTLLKSVMQQLREENAVVLDDKNRIIGVLFGSELAGRKWKR